MLTTKPLHAHFGAEIQLFDFDRLAESGYFDQLQRLFESDSVLVMRALHIDDDQQVALSVKFGPLETTKTGTIGTGSKLVILTNLDDTGEVVEPTHHQWLEGLGNQLWHSDSSFKKVPALASLLGARIIPTEGGETQFVSTRVAYSTLPDKLRRQIDGRIGIHDYAYSRHLIDPNLMTDAEKAELPPVRQPLVRVHPETGEKGLYVGSHLAGIVDMQQEQARLLIDDLTAHATQPHFIYTHRWRSGDLVIWDNRFVMHRGRPYPSHQRRTMVRTTVAGEPATTV